MCTPKGSLSNYFVWHKKKGKERAGWGGEEVENMQERAVNRKGERRVKNVNSNMQSRCSTVFTYLLLVICQVMQATIARGVDGPDLGSLVIRA